VKIYSSLDSVLIDQPTDPIIKDAAVAAVAKDKNPRLSITIDATHSGVITNRRVYPAKTVSTGYKSFTSKANGGSAEYDKPVLKHHDLHEDPIGRIVKASYVPLKSGKEFDEDFKRPDPVGGKGSGVVTVTALITDQESIQKIIDGRYLSVSAGHNTDSMTCSICAKSILKCNHWPGKYYDAEGEETDEENGFYCFYITGNMDYEELSFVNMPAQPPAKLVNFKWEDCLAKSDFEKKDFLIESMTRGKKSMVRGFSLMDDDGEFNLLKGTFESSTKKTVVAMTSPVANNSDKHAETPKVPQAKNSKNSAAQETNIANSNTKDSKMDLTTEQNGLDVQTLQTSLQAVSAEKDKLSKEKAAADQKIATLEATLASKNSEIERLTKAQTDSQVEMSKALATALTSHRMKLGKPDTVSIDSTEKFNEYVSKLAKRSADSLRDAIEDIMSELGHKAPTGAKEKTEDNVTANSSVANQKLGNPAQVDTKSKVVQAGKEQPSKTGDSKRTIDKAFDN